MRKKISVIMPSFNVVEYIDECIKSVMGQTLQDIEILCIDAGSTDGTYEKIEYYSRYDQRIKLINSAVKSYGAQVNQGIKTACGEYIAVVETDDYIDCDMLNRLYRLAVEHRLDYIKADAMGIKKCGDLEIEQEMQVSNTEHSIYNQVISLEKCPQIISMDYYLWRGIYKRDFIIENKIYCNETPGAAYQDIGFTHLVTVNAQRCMFIKDALYYYRINRNGNSSASLNGLQYTSQEYERLITECKLLDILNSEERRYFMIRFAKAVLGEIDYILRNNGYDFASSKIADYYGWVRLYINDYVVNDAEMSEVLSAEEIEQFQILCNDIQLHARDLRVDMEAEQLAIKKMIDFVGDEDVIIFGCGRMGKYVFDKLLSQGVNVVCFCDNNSSMWGKHVGLVEVDSPEQAVRNHSNVKFIIANKYHSQDIYSQLYKLNIQKIYIFNG